MSPKILLDMDGVLADFAFRALQANGLPPDPSLFAKDYYAGVGRETFWRKINLLGPEFWHFLPLTKEANEIVSLAVSYFGTENVGIATSPSQSTLSNCLAGKSSWMHKHFPALASHLIFLDHKELLASPYHLLFDDQAKNVDAFTLAGGEAFLVPRPWNSMAYLEPNLLPFLETSIRDFLRRQNG